MIAIGVDPGSAAGAIAFWNGEILVCHDIPIQSRVVAGRSQKEVDAYALASIVKGEVADADVCALIEQVGPWKSDSKISAANFVGASREIRGVLRALGVATGEISVAAWRKEVGIGKCPAGDKGPVIAKAGELLPRYVGHWRLKKHVHRAEAALIALAAWKRRAEICTSQSGMPIST